MNKKPTILAVAALGSLALIGTGFAGWVIAANAETSAEGTITAYEVTDNRLTIDKDTAAWDDTTGSIKFAKPATLTSYEGAWFTFEGDDTEKLAATYNVTVKSKNADDAGKVKATAEVAVTEGEGKTAWTDAVDAKYVANPSVEIKLGDSTAQQEGDAIQQGGMNYSFIVKFGWGSHFAVNGEAKNPYDFYNSLDAATNGDDAANAMAAIAKINQAKFTLKISFARVD